MPFTCNLDGCGKQFATRAAKNDHRKEKHGKRVWKPAPAHRPFGGMDRDFIYDIVDSMGLPDGAHWAMIEEMSGLEPGDFA